MIPYFSDIHRKTLVIDARELVYLTCLIFSGFSSGGVAEWLKATVC